MEVRMAIPTDCQQIFEFVCELEEEQFDFDLFEKIYLNNIANENAIYLVAVNDENRLTGYISCHGQYLLHHLAKVFEIQELFVRSDYRNKKIGRLLVSALEDEIRKCDCALLEVTTNKKRLDTQRFYENCGFEKTHIKFTKDLSRTNPLEF